MDVIKILLNPLISKFLVYPSVSRLCVVPINNRSTATARLNCSRIPSVSCRFAYAVLPVNIMAESKMDYDGDVQMEGDISNIDTLQQVNSLIQTYRQNDSVAKPVVRILKCSTL